jgi:DsbC/DsbD-like thiol-disulfide interchange protein
VQRAPSQKPQPPGRCDEGRERAFRAPETSDHVRASAVVRAGEKNDEIVVTLQIDDGYHVNANPASFDYLIPTSVAFAGLISPRTNYPKPSRFTSAFAPEGLDVYEGTVPLVVTIPNGAIAMQGELKGEVAVQACDAKICLPPSKLPLSVALQGR